MVSTWKAEANAGVQSCVFPRSKEESEDRLARTFAEGPVVPHWLSVLHRVVTLAVFIVICLGTVALVATLVHAGRVCYERTVHTAHSLGTSATSIRSTLGERP